ncbi:MAG TPA: hypothetical protein VFH95_12755 [Candidatus Kapabacteria bacterium]|nr:hypothetical protein [Candidatus Kapabacteria bacterium]
MKHEEQLNDFFEHALSPAEEQNFLISVAASDELRIAFRSQLELMKAVRSDKDNLRMGSSPVAQVRNRTLAALGLSATAATPFIEQELMRSNKGKIGASNGEQTIAASQAASVAGPGMQWFGHLLHTPLATITAGLLLGILSTTAVEHFTSSNAIPIANPSGVHTRVLDHPMNAPADRWRSGRPRTIETIPAKNGLHNSSITVPVSEHPLRMTAHRANRVSVSNSMSRTTVTKVAANPAIPEVLRSQPGEMHSNKPIIRTNDTAKAKK